MSSRGGKGEYLDSLPQLLKVFGIEREGFVQENGEDLQDSLEFGVVFRKSILDFLFDEAFVVVREERELEFGSSLDVDDSELLHQGLFFQLHLLQFLVQLHLIPGERGFAHYLIEIATSSLVGNK